jgi:hypothetical protein
MKIIVATAAVAALTGILAATTSMARVANSPDAAAAVSSYAADGSGQSQTDQIATHFSGQGASVVVNTLGGKDAVAAAEHAGVVLTIIGLGGVAVLARSRLRAETLARSVKRQPFS